jgi:hypothetical protein
MADEQIVRISPSGPQVLNSNGGGLEFGPGARLRMSESSEVIGDGSVPIPTLITSLNLTGFGEPPIVLALTAPKSALSYRATVECDVISTDTNDDCTIQLFLDTSVDGGTTWVNRASNSHHVACATDLGSDISGAMHVKLDMTKALGSTLGVLADGTTAELLLRCRMACPLNPIGELYSPLTPAPNAANHKGTFHWQLEELF